MYITLQYKSILAEGLTDIFCSLSLYSSALITRLKGVVQQFDTALHKVRGLAPDMLKIDGVKIEARDAWVSRLFVY